MDDRCDTEGDGALENSEEQPLREKNGVQNGSDSRGYVDLASRRKRVLSGFELDDESQNWRSVPSSPSLTPSSSPSSPFRKKLVFTMPGIMRPKEPREYKLRVFVVCTFFVLVLMMSLTYVYHQQHLLKIMQLSLGERIRFGENNRLLHISNADKQNVLTARLGTQLSTNELPRNCPIDESVNETACLEWNHWAMLNIFPHRKSGSAKCYRLHWKSKRDGLILQDCFTLSNAFWYGLGEYTPQLWPMNFLETNNTLLVTGNLSNSIFGHVLNRYWLSSKGVGIIAQSQIPLHVTFDNDVSGQLCLTVNPSKLEDPVLIYTLCAGGDAREVHSYVTETIRSKPIRPLKLDLAIGNVVWSTQQRFGAKINGSQLLNFTESLRAFEHDRSPRALILDSEWQSINGDLVFDETSFNNAKETTKILHNRGYSIILRVHPYVSTASQSYYEHIEDNFWVRDITGEVPSLVRWNDLVSAVVMDFSNVKAVDWFHSKLKYLRDEYEIDSFQFHGGESTSLPPYPTFTQSLQSENDYANLYNEVAINSSLAFSVGVVSQLHDYMSAFTELSPRQSVWGLPRGLRSIIPAVLSTGLVGYTFTLIGPVGGYAISGGPPDRELFVRWLQVAVFFPVLQMSILPSDYDEEVNSIAVKCIQFRRTVVLPQLKVAIDEAVARGTPIIRPLWWLAPNDTNAHDIDSEFLVGNDLLVAPILEPHSDQRDIYLPPGLWTDREGYVHKGGKWIYDHRSSFSKMAYFIRMPELQQQQQPGQRVL